MRTLRLPIALVGLLGIAIDKLVLRWFRDKPAMMALVTTVALLVNRAARSLTPQAKASAPT